MPKNREQLRQEYIDSLDSFISQNPTVGQLDTAKFRDFLIGLVEHESGFNPTAKQGSYFGWYQTNKLDADPYNQHMNAFNHLNGLFNNTITKDDIQKARSLGINDSALMLKYWNQGNRVNNYLWNNKDSADGLGTLISKYGNDLTMPLDVYDYALDNIYGDYTVKEGDNWFNIQKRVRMPGRDYATAGKDLWNMQQLAGRPYGSLKIGQSFTFGEPDDTLIRRPIRKIDRVTLGKYYHYPNKVENTNPDTILYQHGGLVYKAFTPEDEQNKEVKINPQSADYNLAYSPYDTSYDESDLILPVEPVKIYIPNELKFIETQEDQTEDEVKRSFMDTLKSKENGIVLFARRNLNVGNMQDWIDLAKEEGVSFTVYSGVRPGAMTKSGNQSNHSIGMAIDIGPGKGQTFDDLKRQILASPKLVAFMKEKGIGIINETIPEVMRQTGATGPHFHVGPDQWGLQHFERWLRNEKENLHKL